MNEYISYRNIFRIAWPVMLSSLGQNVIYLVDVSFIGRISEYDLGASAMGTIFYFFLFMIGMALNTGMQVMVARRKGEGHHQQIGELVDHQLLMILVLATIEFVVLYFLSASILGAIERSEPVRERALSFLHYRAWGIFFALINSMFMAFFLGIGNTRVNTWTTGVMVAVNVFFLSVLVFGRMGFPRMEIAGAGLASSLAEASVTGIILLYIWRKKIAAGFGMFRFLKLRWRLLEKMLKLSGPLVFQQFISVGSWWLFFIFIEHMGERPLAISNLVRSLYALFGIPVWSLANTVNSMTSNLMGQQRANDVFPLIKKVAAVTLALAISFGMVILLFPIAILSIFTNERDLILASIPTLYTIVVALVLFSVAVLLIYAVSGTGATHISMRIEMVCITAYLIYIYFTAIRVSAPLPVIWLAEVIYWILASVLCYAYLRNGSWRTRTV